MRSTSDMWWLAAASEQAPKPPETERRVSFTYRFWAMPMAEGAVPYREECEIFLRPELAANAIAYRNGLALWYSENGGSTDFQAEPYLPVHGPTKLKSVEVPADDEMPF
jgi:hypothetical protein